MLLVAHIMKSPSKFPAIYTAMCLTFTIIAILNDGYCQEKAPVEQKRSKIDVTNMEINLRLNDFFIHFASSIEEKADKIYYQTTNPGIKKAALMWKLYGISAMNKAMSISDPIASYFDAWSLTKQMVIFFDNGNGKRKFGPYAKIALDISQKMENELDTIFIDLADSERFNQYEPLVDQWVTENPIDEFYFNRKSMIKIFSSWLADERKGLGKSVIDITEEVSNLSTKLNVYADLIPKQAKWQVDYALLTYLTDTSLSINPDKLLMQLDRITRTVELTPKIVDSSLNEINIQRLETLEYFTKEREVVFGEISKLIDNVFWRLTVISMILGLSMVVSIVLYKKL